MGLGPILRLSADIRQLIQHRCGAQGHASQAPTGGAFSRRVQSAQRGWVQEKRGGGGRAQRLKHPEGGQLQWNGLPPSPKA